MVVIQMCILGVFLMTSCLKKNYQDAYVDVCFLIEKIKFKFGFTCFTWRLLWYFGSNLKSFCHNSHSFSVIFYNFLLSSILVFIFNLVFHEQNNV